MFLTGQVAVVNSSIGIEKSLMVQPWIFLQVGHSELDPYISPILHSLTDHYKFHWRGRTNAIGNL